jgi:hypothetical protein
MYMRLINQHLRYLYQTVGTPKALCHTKGGDRLLIIEAECDEGWLISSCAFKSAH